MIMSICFFFFKQKTAYEMRISDWSSDVCSSDLNEDALAQAGWHPFSVDLGFAAGDNTVMITRLTGGGVFPSVTGSKPEQMMPYIADAVRSQTGWEIVFTVGGLSYGSLRPVLILTPILAQPIAQACRSKADRSEEHTSDL